MPDVRNYTRFSGYQPQDIADAMSIAGPGLMPGGGGSSRNALVNAIMAQQGGIAPLPPQPTMQQDFAPPDDSGLLPPSQSSQPFMASPERADDSGLLPPSQPFATPPDDSFMANQPVRADDSSLLPPSSGRTSPVARPPDDSFMGRTNVPYGGMTYNRATGMWSGGNPMQTAIDRFRSMPPWYQQAYGGTYGGRGGAGQFVQDYGGPFDTGGDSSGGGVSGVGDDVTGLSGIGTGGVPGGQGVSSGQGGQQTNIFGEPIGPSVNQDMVNNYTGPIGPGLDPFGFEQGAQSVVGSPPQGGGFFGGTPVGPGLSGYGTLQSGGWQSSITPSQAIDPLGAYNYAGPIDQGAFSTAGMSISDLADAWGVSPDSAAALAEAGFADLSDPEGTTSDTSGPDSSSSSSDDEE